jgi:hypothetical protein
MIAQPAKCQRAIVEARAMPQSRAAPVESDPGAEDGVEESRADPFVTRRFEHPEVVLPRIRVQGDESHRAMTHAGDAGEVDAASASHGQLDERLRAQLLRHRRIQPDAFAGSEPMRLRDGLGDRARGAYPFWDGNRTPLREELLSKGLLRQHDAR